MGGSYGVEGLLLRLLDTTFALSATAPGTAAVVGLCCVFFTTYY